MNFGLDSLSSLPLPSRCDLNPGDWINAKWRILSEIGGGSFGKVYKVEDKDKTVWALKILRLWEVAAELRPSLIERFDVEYTTSLLPGDNIVHSIESGMFNGNPLIVMEYCGGGSLDSMLENGRVDVTKFAKAILDGLEVLHVNGLSHRDLKPDNILIKNDGTPALTDFGVIGNKQHRLTQRNIFGRPFQMFGTYAYMSPEQLTRQRGQVTVLPSTDVFSFGVLVYQMLTQKFPFGTLDGPEDLVRYQKNVKAGIWDRQTLYGAMGGAVWEPLISVCLAVDSNSRPQNATAVKMLLPHIMYDASAPTPTPAPISKPEKKDVYIKIVKGDRKEFIYHLEELCRSAKTSVLRGGRNEDNDIVIEERAAHTSRYHFTIERYDDKWILKDGQCNPGTKLWKRSLNGTKVNEQEIDENGKVLCNRDNIHIGDTEIQFILTTNN